MTQQAIRVMLTNANGVTKEFTLIPGEDIITTFTTKVGVDDKFVINEKSVIFKFVEFVEP